MRSKLTLLSSFIVLCFVLSLSYIGIVKTNTVMSVDNIFYPTIVVDAGHGGFDGGTQSSDGTLEKDINLNISMKLYYLLKLNGYDAVAIRTTDTDVADEDKTTIRQKKISDIHNRLNTVNSIENSLLVSIHQNYFESSYYSGTQVFYSANNSESSVLADCIQKSVVNNIQKDNQRVIKPAESSIYILYKATHPSVMVECGFLSNKEESEKLKTDEYCLKMAYCVAMGICDYSNNGYNKSNV